MTGRCALTATFLVIGALTANAAPASDTSLRTVLALYWSSEDFPLNAMTDATIREALKAQPDIPIDYFTEYLESDRFPDNDATDALCDYLRRKYKGRSIDVVLAISEVAQQFALRHRNEIFPGAAIVFSRVAMPPPEELAITPDQTGIIGGAAYRDTLDLALQVQPDTREVMVVANAPSPGFINDVKAQLVPMSRRVHLTYVTGLPVPAMLERVRKAPLGSIILYARYSQEEAGRVLYPHQVATLVTQAARVPVYVSRDSYLGTGALGGDVRDSRRVGRRVSALALQILRGKRARDIPVENTVMVPTFDWRQIQRWGIDASRIPAGAEILYKEPTAWESYRWYIIGTIVVFAAQVLLIAMLFTQVARRRRAERTIRARETTLLKSYQRIRLLNGRLITAQEEARAGIARELHDDVCQELVGVSLTVGGIKQSTGRVRDPQVQRSLSKLELSVISTVDGLRRLSHDLHPATLKLVGLASALRTHCIEVERRHDVQVAFEAIGPVGHVHPDVALCLFRIAQEALRNGAVHGEARRLRVSITRTISSIELKIADDGGGFDVEKARQEGRGLGLISMEERVRLVGGRAQIVSGGQGTIITVNIPLSATAETEHSGVLAQTNKPPLPALPDSEPV